VLFHEVLFNRAKNEAYAELDMALTGELKDTRIYSYKNER
jgi:hypothetical protein